ncbi:MAG TPA: NAD-dependent epimerase/dehydratase family protein [Chloroflexota bacterium]|nr:NAD-dependent epimerase/dehydratase family protein [Chloroflexota bacterium]
MREVVPRLLEDGHEVRGVDNFMRYGREAPPEGIEFVEGDLTNQETVKRVLDGVEGVIQAAAQIYGVAGFHRYPADILQKDTLLHGLILRQSVELGIRRVVYISSSMVYERLADVAREQDVPNMLVPLTGYGLSKLMGERLSQAFAEQYDLEYTIWRPFNIIGLHERAEGYDPGVCHVFADFIQRIVHERQNPMLILGSGAQVRCFTWIDDVADAVGHRSFDAATRNQDFNLGNPEPVTMIDLAHRIRRLHAEITGQSVDEPLTFTHAPTFADDVQVRIPSVEKAAERLGWRPRVKLDDMLRRCLESELKHDRVEAAAGAE